CGPSLSPPSHLRQYGGRPDARNPPFRRSQRRGASGCSLPHPLPLARCQCATEEEPHHASPRRSLESGADDTEAMSAGRWDHLSRLTEASTRSRSLRRLAATLRPGTIGVKQGRSHHAAHGQAPAKAGSIEKRGPALERYQGRSPLRRAHLRSNLRRITVAVHENAKRPPLEVVGRKRHAARLVHKGPRGPMRAAGRRRIHERQVLLVRTSPWLSSLSRRRCVALCGSPCVSFRAMSSKPPETTRRSARCF